MTSRACRPDQINPQHWATGEYPRRWIRRVRRLGGPGALGFGLAAHSIDQMHVEQSRQRVMSWGPTLFCSRMVGLSIQVARW